MREEKKYLVREVEGHLKKSQYCFIANYNKMTFKEISALRRQLSGKKAEFHVVKNSALKHAAKTHGLPDLAPSLAGQTALVVGGDSPSEVAKILLAFFKENNEKCSVKMGVLDGERVLDKKDVDALSKLPTLEVIRAQLLSLMNTPATQLVRVIQGVPQGFLNVLQAKAKKA